MLRQSQQDAEQRFGQIGSAEFQVIGEQQAFGDLRINFVATAEMPSERLDLLRLYILGISVVEMFCEGEKVCAALNRFVIVESLAERRDVIH